MGSYYEKELENSRGCDRDNTYDWILCERVRSLGIYVSASEIQRIKVGL